MGRIPFTEPITIYYFSVSLLRILQTRYIINPMPSKRDDLLSQLFKPVDASSLGMFRALFGILLLFQAYWVYAPGFVLENYIKPIYHFPFSLFEFLRLPRLSFFQLMVL